MHYTFCLPSLILRKTSIFSLVLQKAKSSFIMLSGGDIGIYYLEDLELFSPLTWCTSTYTDLAWLRKPEFLEHYPCLEFEQQKITKRLIFTHIKYSFFPFSVQSNIHRPSACPSFAAGEIRSANSKIPVYMLFSSSSSCPKASLAKYIPLSRPWPTWTFCLIRNEYWLALYAEK